MDGIQPKQSDHPNLNAGYKAFNNDNAMKFSTPESRKALCTAYCRHLEQGFTDESFSDCDMRTFKRYCQDFPSDLQSDIIEKARRKRRLFWERIGMNGTMGIPMVYKARNEDGTDEIRESNGRFNDRSWKFIMANMFGWRDRSDVTTDYDAIKMPQIFIPRELNE